MTNKTFNRNKFLEHHEAALRRLNNLYIESRVVVQTLKRIKKVSDGEMSIRVPSTVKETSPVKRSLAELQEIVERTIERREYEKTLTFVVSTVEDYLISYVRLILYAFPERILTSIKGNDSKIQIDFVDLVKQDKNAIIESKVRARLEAALYASPAEYTAYVGSLIGKPLRKDALDRYFEIKAARDLIVHANSVVNETYLKKTDSLARAKQGDILPVDKEYFDASIRVAKQVCVSAYRTMTAQYGDNENIAKCLQDRGF